MIDFKDEHNPLFLENTVGPSQKEIQLKPLATIEELASTYIFLIKNDLITGQHIAVDESLAFEREIVYNEWLISHL